MKMKLGEERKTLEKENARIDKVIDTLFKKPKRKFVKDELLDISREVKAIIANVVRLIDGQ